MQRMFFVATVLVALVMGIVGCGGEGDSGSVVPPTDPYALSKEAVEPNPGATVHRFTHIMIKPPSPDLEYGIGIANAQGEIPYGEWYFWTHSPEDGYQYHTVPFGEYHIPVGAIEVGFIATYGLVSKDDLATQMTMVFFAEKNGMVDPQVDWSWDFTVDPSLPSE